MRCDTRTEVKLNDVGGRLITECKNEAKIGNKCYLCVIESLESQLTMAVEALEKYGVHGVGCPHFLKENGWTGFECECGLTESIAKI